MKKHSKEKIQLVNELHKPIRKNFPRRSTIIRGFDDLWQSDLAQLDLYAKSNRNFKYILVVIDCYSKCMWARPLKTKEGEEVTHAFRDILSSSGRRPNNLQTDQGREYYNAHFKKMMQQYGINHYTTYSPTKAAMAERVIRTLKEKLFKYFSLNGTYKWIDILSKMVQDYNTQRHHTTNMRPIDVTKTTKIPIFQVEKSQLYRQWQMRDANKYFVGQKVRISKAKHIFSKGYTPNWTTEIFEIIKVNRTSPITYTLRDLAGNNIMGTFYEQELQKTENPKIYLVEKILKHKGDKVKVRWLGFDQSHDSWINKANIV